MSNRIAPAALALLVILITLTPGQITFAQPPVMPALRSAHTAVAAVHEGAMELTLDAEEPTETAETESPDLDDTLAHDMSHGRTIGGFIRHRVIHFTFDDGPRPSTTSRLLETLDEYDVRATFFIVGRQLQGARHERQRELVREMARRGHTIGSHTFNHANLRTLTDEEILSQLTRSEAVFEQTLGDRPTLIRPPYGARNQHVDALLGRHGYTEVMWNITAEDTTSRDPETMLQAFRNSLDRQERHPRGPGGIVLLHDTHAWVVDAVPLMLEELRARNCALLAQGGEELWDIADDPRMFYQPLPGSAPRFATTVQLDDETVAARQEVVRAHAMEYCN